MIEVGRAVVPTRVPEPPRSRRRLPPTRPRDHARPAREGAQRRARTPRLPDAAVGGRVGRGGGRLPDRAGVQRRARRAPAQARRRAAPADTDRDAIVERQFPEGDQFLFITARDGTGLDVAFVDPDAGGPESAAALEEPADPGGLTIARVALEPDGTEAEATFLLSALASLAERVRLVGRRQGGRSGGGTRAGLLAVRGSARRAGPDRVPRPPRSRDGDGGTARCAPLLGAGGPLDRAAPAARDAPARAHGRARRSRRARGERCDAHGTGGQVRGCGRLRSFRPGARDDVRRLGRRPRDADSQKRRRRTSSCSMSPGWAPTRC